jgi:hypothetical protein
VGVLDIEHQGDIGHALGPVAVADGVQDQHFERRQRHPAGRRTARDPAVIGRGGERQAEFQLRQGRRGAVGKVRGRDDRRAPVLFPRCCSPQCCPAMPALLRDEASVPYANELSTFTLRFVDKLSVRVGSVSGWRFWIDRGGTFTDIVARSPEGRLSTAKLLSENLERYADAAIAGIRQILGLGADEPWPAGAIDEVKMGTTVATNALLERKGARTLLVVDRGFADLLTIGDQTRPDLFDLAIRQPAPLHEGVLEVGGRIDRDGHTVAPLDEAEVLADLRAARAQGYAAVAIALAHAWAHPGWKPGSHGWRGRRGSPRYQPATPSAR